MQVMCGRSVILPYRSTVILPLQLDGESGHFTGMFDQLIARIDERLEALGLTAAGASKKASLSADAIRNIYRAQATGSRKGVSTRTIEQLAEALETTPQWLMGSDAETLRPSTVPVVGYVQAGAEAVLFSAGQGPFDYVTAPEGSTEHTVAAEIRGTSLGPLFNEWLVFYDDVRSPVTEDLYGALCIVGLPDGKVVVKQIKPSRSPGLYHLVSQTEGMMPDQEVLWAAKVTAMAPR